MTNGHITHRRPSRFGEISRRAKHIGRIIAFLTREQLDFIDKISKDALFSTGKKLSRTAIIQAIIETVRGLDLSGKDIHSADELEERMSEVVKEKFANFAEEIKKAPRIHSGQSAESEAKADWSKK